MRKFVTSKRGIVSLGAMLILGAIVVEIGLVGAALIFILNVTNFGVRLSAEALAAADAGVRDGMLRVVRGDYPTSPPTYDMPSTGNAGATITVCPGLLGNVPGSCNGSSSGAANKVEIISLAQAFTKKRKLVAVLEVQPVTGLVSLVSLRETPL